MLKSALLKLGYKANRMSELNIENESSDDFGSFCYGKTS